MGKERDELADVFADQPITLGPKPKTLMRGHAQEIAERILAAGYRKPRIITTAEELDRMPTKSVVLDDDVCVKRGDGYWKVSDLAGVYASSELDLPVTVIWEPAT